MSAQNYARSESEYMLNFERNALAGDLLVGIGYGIQLLMYYSASTYIWRRRKKRRLLYLWAYMTVLLMLETVFVAVQARTLQIIYIDNREAIADSGINPWDYFLATQNLPVNVAFNASFFVLTFLSDLLVFWRCWVVWAVSGKAAYIATFFPALLLLASFVMGTLWTLQSSQPGLSFYSALPMAYGTSYYAISLGANVVLSILIASRLLFYRKRITTAMPQQDAKQYLSLLTVIIESAALYSVFAFIFLVTYAIGDPTNQSWFAIANCSQQIANYLIIYRIAEGSAWSTDTLSRSSLPTTAVERSLAPPVGFTMTNISSVDSVSDDGLKH